MKIKLKSHNMTTYTFDSPYPHENGTHTIKNILAYCGNCGRCVEEAKFDKSWNYCPYCGEKIDWEEEERSE